MLYRSVRAQMRVILKRRTAWIAFYIMFVLMVANYVVNLFLYRNYDLVELFHPAKILLLSYGSETGMGYFLMQIYPLLVILPAGFSLASDYESGESVFLHSRVGGMNYYMGKMIAAFLSAAIIFTVPLLLEIGMNFVTYPKEAVGDPSNWKVYGQSYIEAQERYFLSALAVRSPYLYAVVGTVIFGVASGILNMFTVAVSTIRVKFKVLLFLPVYLLLDLISIVVRHIPGVTVSTYYGAYLRIFNWSWKSGAGYAGVLFLLTIFSAGMMYRKGKKDMIL